MGQHKRILIISHVATRSGAPILLLHLMKLLREHGYRFNTLIAAGTGPLFGEFEKLSDKCCKYVPPKQSELRNMIKHKLTGKKLEFNIGPFLQDIDFVFSNTLTNGHIIELIRKYYDGPIISYVHELHTVASINTNSHFVKLGLSLSNKILVPCNAVKNYLQTEHKISDDKIGLLNYFIPGFHPVSENELAAFRVQHFLNASFIVGGLGNIEWRKGVDLFIQVAALVCQKMPQADIQFIWMGGKKESLEYQQILFDIKKLGLENKVILTESSAATGQFMKNVNLLLLSSREDPYPVVVLEAASEKIPTICFANSGGAPEFVEDDAGIVVDYLDVCMMEDALLKMYKDKEFLARKAVAAKEKCMARHSDKELIYTQFKRLCLS